MGTNKRERKKGIVKELRGSCQTKSTSARWLVIEDFFINEIFRAFTGKQAKKRGKETGRAPSEVPVRFKLISALWFFYSIVTRPRGNATRFLVSSYIDL